jgi:thiamine pyrophosphokinase
MTPTHTCKRPNAIHGDLDSLKPEVRDYYEKLGCTVSQDPDQYTTDFTKCLKWIKNSDYLSADTPTGEKFSRGIDVIALGGLGGRVDQGFSQIHQLYAASRDQSLLSGNLLMVSSENITFVLQAGHNKISTPMPPLAESVGIIPVGKPAIITTKGLEWDVTDWETEFGSQISTSNHLKSDIVEVTTSEPVVFTVELS